MTLLSTSTGKLSIKAIFTVDGDYPKLTTIYLGPHDDTKKPERPKVGLKNSNLKTAESKTFTTTKKDFKFYFNVSDKDSSVKYIKIAQSKDLKGASWKSYDGDIKLSFDNDGKKNIYFKLKDENGNITDTFKQTIKVDSTVPELTITKIGTFVPDFTKFNDYIYTAENPTIEGITEEDSMILLYVDGKEDARLSEVTTNCIDKDGPDTCSFQLAPTLITNGKHSLYLLSEDPAGNQTQKELTISINP